jgi:hypothetical protein
MSKLDKYVVSAPILSVEMIRSYVWGSITPSFNNYIYVGSLKVESALL